MGELELLLEKKRQALHSLRQELFKITNRLSLVNPVDAYQVMSSILLLGDHFDEKGLTITMDSPTAPHLLIDRMVKQLNSKHFWAKESIPVSVMPIFLLCALFPFYFSPIWSVMVGTPLTRLCFPDGDDAFEKNYSYKNSL